MTGGLPLPPPPPPPPTGAPAGLAPAVVAVAEPIAEAVVAVPERVAVAERVAVLSGVAPSGVAPSGVRVAGRAARRAEHRRARQRRNRRIGIACGATAVVAALAGGGFVLLPSSHPVAVAHAAAPKPAQQSLLLEVRGQDGRAIESALLVHDPATHTGAALLVPTSVAADLPGHGSMTLADSTKFDSVDLPAETLGDLLGVTIDGTWTLSTDDLAALIDRVGGVTVDVDVDVTAADRSGARVVVVPHGNGQHLTGIQAVDFATHLEPGEQEQARLARLDAVLSAVVGALPTNASGIASRIDGLVDGQRASVGASTVAGLLASLSADNRANNLTFDDLPVQPSGSGGDVDTVDSSALPGFVQHYLHGSVRDNGGAAATRVVVLNGTGALDLGESARRRLLAHQLDFLRSGNQQGFTFRNQHSAVLIADDTDTARRGGTLVAEALGLTTSDIALVDQPVPGADVVVILGKDYRP